jgi:hypothetical protein
MQTPILIQVFLPLSLAALHCDKVIADMLIKAGARPDMKDAVSRETASTVARREGCPDLLQ